MRPQKVNDEELMEKMLPLVRKRGYVGTSLNELAAVTGLKKASLYHRFPGGKEEIIHAMLRNVSAWVKENIIEVLKEENNRPEKRLKAAIKNIATFYDNGKSPCLLRSLSMETGEDLFVKELNAGMERWIEAFMKLGSDLGLPENEARDRATETLVLIQGSLVVSQTLKNTQPFKQALVKIEKMYTLK